MMNKHSKKKFQLSTIPKDRQEWLAARVRGLGGSEVAAVLGLNPYQCSLEVFRKKIGMLPEDGRDNLIMFMGRLIEPVIAQLWEHWEGSAESVMENMNAGKKIRNCVEMDYSIQNMDYPHLFAHLDRLITKSKKTIYDRSNGVLELKTINGWSVNKWEEGIPPYHMAQLQTYLLITDLDYGEVAMLVDGRKLQVHKFERDEPMIEQIIDATTEFWEKVLEAREIWDDYTIPEEKQYKLIAEIEPTPDGSEGWTAFLKEQYKVNPELPILEGNDEILEYARQYNLALLRENEGKEEKAYWGNKIKYLMGNHQEIQFEGNGKITWKTRGKNRTLSIRLKHYEFAS